MFCHRKLHINCTSFKRSPVLKDQFLCPKGDLLIQSVFFIVYLIFTKNRAKLNNVVSSSKEDGYDPPPLQFTLSCVKCKNVIPERCHLLAFKSCVPYNNIIFRQSAQGIHLIISNVKICTQLTGTTKCNLIKFRSLHLLVVFYRLCNS